MVIVSPPALLVVSLRLLLMFGLVVVEGEGMIGVADSRTRRRAVKICRAGSAVQDAAVWPLLEVRGGMEYMWTRGQRERMRSIVSGEEDVVVDDDIMGWGFSFLGRGMVEGCKWWGERIGRALERHRGRRCGRE